MSDLVSCEVGDLLNLRFADASFDVVWTQHVVMNIRNRERLYDEFRRVLKPGGTFVFYDIIAADGAPEPYFPVPWAGTSETNFLLTKDATIAALQGAGLTLGVWNDVTDAASAWFGEQPPPLPESLSLATLMGSRFAEMRANLARNIRGGRIRFAMGSCEASGART